MQSPGLQIAKVDISTIGSLSWMTNEVMDATYFNLAIYSGTLVTRLTDNPITYASWTNSTTQNLTTFPIDGGVTGTTSIPNAFTAPPSTQTFQLPLQTSIVSIQIEAPCSSNPGMTVTYSLDTPDPLLLIGANSSYDVSLNIDMPNIDVAAFGANQFFTISNSIEATAAGPLTSLAPFQILIFKCPNATCLTCSTYNSAEQRGICSQCDSTTLLENEICTEKEVQAEESQEDKEKSETLAN